MSLRVARLSACVLGAAVLGGLVAPATASAEPAGCAAPSDLLSAVIAAVGPALGSSSGCSPAAEPPLNTTVIPGSMKSDRDPVPVPFSKSEADLSETIIASMDAGPDCTVYWPSAKSVCGPIRTKFESVGGPTGFLGYPVSPQVTDPVDGSQLVQFLNGQISWTQVDGAQIVSLRGPR